MNKILLVTKIGKNYGALLQAYALKQVLEDKYNSVQILNYQLDITMHTYDVIPAVTGIRSLKNAVKSLRRKSATKKSVERCLKFREDYFNFTQPYKSIAELRKNPPSADILVTGSDQVWNPEISFDPAYYLQFGDKNATRCSYAASVGIEDIPEAYRSKFIRRVKKVKFRSVREHSAQKLLSSYGISSQVHVDPTLLLSASDYDRIAESPDIKEPYILLYLLKLPENYRKYISEIKRLFPHHRIVSIPGGASAPSFDCSEIADIGPKEFIGLIRGADAVLTTSFHGTVFSVIYGRPFLSVLPEGTGGRIRDLLSVLELSSHIISDYSELKKLPEKYSHGQVEQILNKLRKESFCYLRQIKDSVSGEQIDKKENNS